MPPPDTPKPRANVTTSVQKPRNVPAREAGLISIIRPSVPIFHSPRPRPSRIKPGVTNPRISASDDTPNSTNASTSTPTPMYDISVLSSRLNRRETTSWMLAKSSTPCTPRMRYRL